MRPPVELITGDWKTIGLAVDVLEIFQVADLQVNKEPSTVSDVSRAKI